MSDVPTPTANNSRLERLSRAHERQLVEIQQLREKVSEAEKAAAKIAKENEALKQAADESIAIKRVGELEGELRGIKHRKVIDKLATAAGLKPEAVEGFMKLAEYKADGEPDEAKITQFIAAKKVDASLSWMFQPAPDPNAPPPLKATVGSGQGNGTGINPFALGPDDPRMSDVKFLMENHAAIAQAKAEQLARGELRG